MLWKRKESTHHGLTKMVLFPQKAHETIEMLSSKILSSAKIRETRQNPRVVNHISTSLGGVLQPQNGDDSPCGPSTMAGNPVFFLGID